MEEGSPTLPPVATPGPPELSSCSKLGAVSSPPGEGTRPHQEVNVLESPPTGRSSFLLVFAIL